MSVSACCAKARVVRQPSTGLPGRCTPCSEPIANACCEDSGEINLSAPNQIASFTNPAPGLLVPLTPMSTTLNGAGSLLFDNGGGAGQLRYVGTVRRRFLVQVQVVMAWTASGGAPPNTDAGFVIGILKNGATFALGSGAEDLNIGNPPATPPSVDTFTAQAIVLLDPGNVLEVGIASSRPVGEKETMTLFVYSLIAAA